MPDGTVSLSKVQLGRNLGREVEVLSGLPPDATVIDSPPESLIPGQMVSVAGRQQRQQEQALSEHNKLR